MTSMTMPNPYPMGYPHMGDMDQYYCPPMYPLPMPPDTSMYMAPQQPGIPGQATPSMPSGSVIPGVPTPPGAITEESYIENILRMNRGKVGTFYMTYENNSEWNAKIFRGVIETAGRDHIIISDPQTGRRYLLMMVNLDYVTFDEELNYVPPALLPSSR